MPEADLTLFAKAPHLVPQLQQLSLALSDVQSPGARLLLLGGPLRSLQLTALSLRVAGQNLDTFAAQLCEELRPENQPRLVSLEMHCSRFYDDRSFQAFWSVFLKQLAVGPKIEVFGVSSLDFEGDVLIDLCRLLDQMPLLKDFRVTTYSDCQGSMDELCAFFNSAFRPIRTFGCPMLPYRSRIDLLASVAKNTRLRTLYCHKSTFDMLVVEGGLADAGWLTDVCDLSCTLPEALSKTLERNRRRHEHCRRSCSALVAARKQKKTLMALQQQLVVYIARYMWNTRNLCVWDR